MSLAGRPTLLSGKVVPYCLLPVYIHTHFGLKFAIKYIGTQ